MSKLLQKPADMVLQFFQNRIYPGSVGKGFVYICRPLVWVCILLVKVTLLFDI